MIKIIKDLIKKNGATKVAPNGKPKKNAHVPRKSSRDLYAEATKV